MAENLNQEQAAPADGTGPDCWELVLADMRERRAMGIEKYGKPLRPDNGRDALVDAYQESLDLTVYLRQAIEQQKAVEEYLNNEIHHKMVAHGKSLEELVQVRSLLFQLIEAVARFGNTPVAPDGGEVVRSFTELATLAARIARETGYSVERSSLARFWAGNNTEPASHFVWAVEFFCLSDRTGRVLGLFATEEKAKAFAEEQRRTTVCPQEDFVWQVRRVEVQS